VVMGGTTEPIANALKESYAENADLRDALHIAVDALRAGSADASNGDQPSLDVASLEVAILDASRPRRAFRRIGRSTLEALLEVGSKGSDSGGEASDSDGDSSD
jgi:proteasome alpha subunit